MTCCPWAGLSHDEVFDVRPYAQKLAYAFIRKPLTQNLPRKFKFTFDGCGHDCTLGNHIIMANNASVSGHVKVGDYANFGGYAGIPQYRSVGAHARQHRPRV